MMTENFDKPAYYTNRELSWIDFNNRCLQEARDTSNPLLERVNFFWGLRKVMLTNFSWFGWLR